MRLFGSGCFIKAFIRCRGNVREMEREIGISYWAMRRMLDELIQKLHFEVEPTPETDATAQMQQILEKLDRGEMNAPDAIQALKQLKRTEPE